MEDRVRMMAVAESQGLAEEIIEQVLKIYGDEIIGLIGVYSDSICPDDADVFVCFTSYKVELTQHVPVEKIVGIDLLGGPQLFFLSEESLMAIGRWFMRVYRTLQEQLQARTLELTESLDLLKEGHDRHLKVLAKLEYESTHDAMTDCRNRRYFDQCLRRVDMDRMSSIAVIVADLKGLKLVNDSLGHAEGDKIIYEAACILRECVRRQDTVARLGGDEFGVLFEDIDKFELLRIVRQMRGKVNKWRKQKPVPVGLSIGYAIDDRQEVCSSHLLKIADKKMYQDKNKVQQIQRKSSET